MLNKCVVTRHSKEEFLMTNTYTTVQGDTWDLISYKLFGSEVFTSELMALNYARRMITVFPSGILLSVPEIDTSAQTKELDLPPWKRI